MINQFHHYDFFLSSVSGSVPPIIMVTVRINGRFLGSPAIFGVLEPMFVTWEELFFFYQVVEHHGKPGPIVSI